MDTSAQNRSAAEPQAETERNPIYFILLSYLSVTVVISLVLSTD